MKIRILSLALAIIMLIGIVPFAATPALAAASEPRLPTQAEIDLTFTDKVNPRVLEINRGLYNSMKSDPEIREFLTLPTVDKIDYPDEWQEIADLAASLTKSTSR